MTTKRIILYPGSVGDYDGAYDWQREDDYRPSGEYPETWSSNYFRIVDVVADLPGLLAAARAEGAREALERVANQFQERYDTFREISRDEVQAFLDSRRVHNGIPEPPR